MPDRERSPDRGLLDIERSRSIKQRSRWYAKSLGDRDDVLETQVPLATFDPSDVGSVQTGAFAESRLRELLLAAQTSHGCAELDFGDLLLSSHNEADRALSRSCTTRDFPTLGRVGFVVMLTRESISKSALDAFHDRKEATGRFSLAATILCDTVLETIRRELRRAHPELKIDVDEIRTKLLNDVLKRDTIEGEKAEAAQKRVKKAAAKLLRLKKTTEEAAATPPPPAVTPQSTK